MIEDDELVIETKPKRNKLFSGRLWLTAIAGIAFLEFSTVLCIILYSKKGEITSSDLTSIMNILFLIISNVMTFYFTKNRDETPSLNDKKELIKTLTGLTTKETE